MHRKYLEKYKVKNTNVMMMNSIVVLDKIWNDIIMTKIKDSSYCIKLRIALSSWKSRRMVIQDGDWVLETVLGLLCSLKLMRGYWSLLLSSWNHGTALVLVVGRTSSTQESNRRDGCWISSKAVYMVLQNLTNVLASNWWINHRLHRSTR